MNPAPIAYGVRYKGHWVAAVKTGFSRKPILLRAKKGEKRYEEPIDVWPNGEDMPKEGLPEKRARLACARAINRTKERAFRLSFRDNLLRGVPSVERLLSLLATEMRTRRGKRWKICPIYHEPRTNPPAVPPSEPRHDQEELVHRNFAEGREAPGDWGKPDPAKARAVE